jgi:hypothetical protein
VEGASEGLSGVIRDRILSSKRVENSPATPALRAEGSLVE